MLLHYLGKLKIQIFCRYSAYTEENTNKLHFECTDFNSSMRLSVWWVYLVYLLFSVFTEYLKYLSIRMHSYFLPQNVGGSEKSRLITVSASAQSDVPFALTQARSRSHHSSMTVCGMLNQVSMRRRLRSAVSRTAVLLTGSCMRLHTW